MMGADNPTLLERAHSARTLSAKVHRNSGVIGSGRRAQAFELRKLLEVLEEDIEEHARAEHRAGQQRAQQATSLGRRIARLAMLTEVLEAVAEHLDTSDSQAARGAAHSVRTVANDLRAFAGGA